MSALLEGIRVLDLTTILAGPFAAYQLSLFGADVIKIEMPIVGDLARELGSENPKHISMMGASFVAQNSGKRSITIDLKSESGRLVFESLVKESDVLLENMRPGVLTRLGFSWEKLRAINPGLVYCAVSGFGQTGPLAERPAYDQIIQGLAGMADVTGFPDRGPVRVGFPIADTLGGFSSAMAICAALFRRQRDGQGCFLDVSMLETALTAMGWAVSDQLIGKRLSARNGNDNVTSAPSGTFKTREGALNIAANTQAQFETLCRALGCERLTMDQRFLTRAARKENRATLTAELEPHLLTRTAAEWESLLAAVGVPAGRVLTVQEALEQEQIRVRQLIHKLQLGTNGRESLFVLGSGVHVDGEALAPSSPPPLLGEHTDEVLTSVGFSPEEIRHLHAIGAI